MMKTIIGIANGGLDSTQRFRLMAYSQAVKAQGFDPCIVGSNPTTPVLDKPSPTKWQTVGGRLHTYK